MPEGKRVVAHIRNLLDSRAENATAAAADLAERYAALCGEANERLQRCDAYLNQGMRTEAVHLAETLPPVLDEAAALDFHGVEAWGDFCSLNTLPMAPPIAREIVARLNAAYVEEDSLASLLTEYRRVVRRGTRQQSISVLRRLAQLDPENTNWPKDLAEFERARLKDLGGEVASAVRGQDVALMQSLLSELQNPGWLSPPDPRFATALQGRINEVRSKEIAARILAGYGERDVARTDQALQEWQALLEAGGYSPPSDLAGQVHEANQWCQNELQAQGDLNSLASALQQDAGIEELERRVEAVNRHNRQIPEYLRARVERALADARHAASRRFRLKAAAVAVLVVAVATPLFFIARSTLRERRRLKWADLIDSARMEKDYETARKHLDELEQRLPGLYGEPYFRELAAKVDSEWDQFKKDRESFRGIMEQLAEIRSADFPADRPYADLEAKAAESAHGTAEEEELAEWRTARKAHEAQRRQGADAEFSGLVDGLGEQLNRLSRLDPQRDYEPYRDLFEKIRADVDRARALPDVSEQLRSKLAPLEQRVATHAKSFEKIAERIERKSEMLADIGRALPDIKRFESLLGEFVAEFRKDPDTRRIEQMRRDALLGIDLMQGARWATDDLEALAQQAKQFRALPGFEKSIWRDAVKWISHRTEGARRAVDVRHAVEALQGNWRYHDLYSFSVEARDTGVRQRYYHREKGERKLFGPAGGKQYVVYTANVFGEEHREKRRSFTTLKYELLVSERPEENLAPHCKLVRRLISEIERAHPMDYESLLLRTAEDARVHPDIDPVMKVALLRLLLKEAGDLSFEHGEKIEKVMSRLSRMDLKVYWMDANPDAETAVAKKEMARLATGLSEIPAAAEVATIRDQMFRMCLSREPRCVGSVVAGDGGLSLKLQGATPAEAWVITLDKASRPAVYIVAARGPGGTLDVLPSMRARLYDGQPVFAPSGGKKTAEILRSVLKGRHPGQTRVLRGIAWPLVWPVNARSLE